jgi:hypothetical protein
VRLNTFNCDDPYGAARRRAQRQRDHKGAPGSLSAGVIQSPRILLLSGVGAPDTCASGYVLWRVRHRSSLDASSATLDRESAGHWQAVPH